MATRIRKSIQQLQADYDAGNRTELENLIKAWRGIQALPSHHPNSFFNLAAYHGQPFHGPGNTDPDWWGGYCNHANVLFPTWHRAYLWRLEEALRSIEGCGAVTLPFWDELADEDTPIPAVLTSPTWPFGPGVSGALANPLYSYTLAEGLVHNVKGDEHRYTKPAGYTTVRYPQSGLVGTEEDRKYTAEHNAIFANASQNTELLNLNVKEWLSGELEIPRDPSGARIPDTFSVRKRWHLCLHAPNYTVFSNTSSQTQWSKDFGKDDPHFVVSLESPHNAIHLAVGGFYQAGRYNASPIIGANGDIGANEVAGFDPIFYLHHCFVDYAFWTWQKWHNKTARGSLQVIPYYPGAVIKEGIPNLPPGTLLDMTTPLYPFRHPTQLYVTSHDVTDIAEMGYDYGFGSLDPLLKDPAAGLVPDIQSRIVNFKHVHGINRAKYPGSFVVRTFVGRKGGAREKRVEIGREPILSRRNVKGCANCQNSLEVESLVPIYDGMLEAIVGRDSLGEVEYSVDIHTNRAFDELGKRISDGEGDVESPLIDDLW